MPDFFMPTTRAFSAFKECINNQAGGAGAKQQPFLTQRRRDAEKFEDRR
jgi:hypothetical protein